MKISQMNFVYKLEFYLVNGKPYMLDFYYQTGGGFSSYFNYITRKSREPYFFNWSLNEFVLMPNKPELLMYYALKH